jgi:hypothetical protein
VCVKAPFPMRFARAGSDPGFRPAKLTEARVLVFPGKAGPDRDPDPEKANISSLQQEQIRFYKKTPLLQLAQTKKEQLNSTPAPASTLVFSHSLLPSVPVANRGQASKNYFINSLSRVACSWPSEFGRFFKDIDSLRRCRMRGCAPPGVSV